MVKLLNGNVAGFNFKLKELLRNKVENNPEISQKVAKIINDVATRGDEALFEYTSKFDRTLLSYENIRITKRQIDEAYQECTPEAIEALKFSAKRINDYHHKQTPDNFSYKDSSGVQLGWKWTAIHTVGIYVPGGLATYPSTILMNAIPAQVAGVNRIVMVVPTPDNQINPIVLAAARIANIDEIYQVGGAQAIAALAYGTQSIPPVDKIVGPGNVYVQEAKRQVFGKVGIDIIAGPSEILVISDRNSNPEWIAADLLSQAEHDKDARSILITDDEDFAKKVISAVEENLKTLKRAEIAKVSWENNGMVIVVNTLNRAAELANIIATEHLELAVDNPSELEKRIHNAGAIFLGRYTPEAVGDYTAGPSHVLPTSGSSRFSSGLSVFDFLKRSSIMSCSKSALQKIGEETLLLATQEGLDAHALSVSLRMDKNDD